MDAPDSCILDMNRHMVLSSRMICTRRTNSLVAWYGRAQVISSVTFSSFTLRGMNLAQAGTEATVQAMQCIVAKMQQRTHKG